MQIFSVCALISVSISTNRGSPICDLVRFSTRFTSGHESFGENRRSLNITTAHFWVGIARVCSGMLIVSTALRSLINRTLAPFGEPPFGGRFESIDTMLATAERKSGLGDWGEPSFRDALSVLLGALEEVPDLTPLGVVTFNNVIRQALVNRLRFLNDSAPRHDLKAPVIITGLPRSGTTALHRLLAVDPVFHAPPLWELLDPFLEPGVDLRRWRATAQITIKNRLLPDLDRKHYTRAGTPEECTLLLANSLASPLFWDLAPLDGYLEWVQAADQRPVYEDYRRQLEILQARHANRRLLLKAPAHVGNLAVLREVIPEAELVQTHRDPTECFFSHCSLRETLGRFVVERPDRMAIADQVRRVFDFDLNANVEFHEDHPDEVVNVACGDLRTSSLEVFSGLGGALDLEWSRESADRAAAYLGQNPGGRFGKHLVSGDDWGVSRETVDQLFPLYREKFADFLEK